MMSMAKNNGTMNEMEENQIREEQERRDKTKRTRDGGYEGPRGGFGQKRIRYYLTK
jgi:hypothetical protein